MLRARKYWFALCFWVLSNQYVERSAYANVFKFNRENKRFERTKVKSRTPCWSPSDGLQNGVSKQNPIIFSETFCRITRVRNIASPELWHVVYLLLFYDIATSWLNLLNGKRLSRRSVTPRDLRNTGSPAGFPKTRAKKWGGMLRIKSAMLSLCLCECGPHSPIATLLSLFP